MIDDVGDCCCFPHHGAAAGWIAVGTARSAAGAGCPLIEGPAASQQVEPPQVRGARRAPVHYLGASLAARSPWRDDLGRSAQALLEQAPPLRAAVLQEFAPGQRLAPCSFDPASLWGLPRSRRPFLWCGCASWEPHRRRAFPPQRLEPVAWASAHPTQKRQSSRSSRVRLQRTTVFPPTQRDAIQVQRSITGNCTPRRHDDVVRRSAPQAAHVGCIEDSMHARVA